MKDKDAGRRILEGYAEEHATAKVTMHFMFTEKEVGTDPKTPVGSGNPFDHREPLGTSFPAMELERMAGTKKLANVVVKRGFKASTLSHVPRTHLANLLKAATYLDDS